MQCKAQALFFTFIGMRFFMSRKILALDLDGTLTDSNKEITPRTKEMIAKMQEQGHIVVLASGRPTPGVQRVADKLHLSEMGGYMLS